MSCVLITVNIEFLSILNWKKLLEDSSIMKFTLFIQFIDPGVKRIGASSNYYFINN